MPGRGAGRWGRRVRGIDSRSTSHSPRFNSNEQQATIEPDFDGTEHGIPLTVASRGWQPRTEPKTDGGVGLKQTTLPNGRSYQLSPVCFQRTHANLISPPPQRAASGWPPAGEFEAIKLENLIQNGGFDRLVRGFAETSHQDKGCWLRARAVAARAERQARASDSATERLQTRHRRSPPAIIKRLTEPSGELLPPNEPAGRSGRETFWWPERPPGRTCRAGNAASPAALKTLDIGTGQTVIV